LKIQPKKAKKAKKEKKKEREKADEESDDEFSKVRFLNNVNSIPDLIKPRSTLALGSTWSS
jgi:hypothetical protein